MAQYGIIKIMIALFPLFHATLIVDIEMHATANTTVQAIR